jgi:UDP-N-acetylmuramoylalanine--D-glutamate ligase
VNTALVLGMAQTGEAVARFLRTRGWDVVAVDDAPTDAARERAAGAGLELVGAPDIATLDALVRSVDLVCPSPGVPRRHPVFELAEAAAVPAWSEFELAARMDHPPLVAVTGTNGKTTVTTLIAMMLTEAGRHTIAAGNNEVPLVEALDSGEDYDVIVVEASSSRLDLTETFRPIVGVWLNVSEDHVDWHGSMAAYIDAKAKIWARQLPDDLAVANADDPTVLDAARHAPSRVATYAVDAPAADAVLRGDDLVVNGDLVAHRSELPRAWPHDVSNALAACIAALAAGADVESCGRVLREFRGLPHRVQLIGDSGGVRFFDDSKATTPASVVTAVSGFDSVVLIAGGRNKDLDLGVLGSISERVRAVVAIGEAAPEIEAAFAGRTPVVAAHSMDEAVRVARDFARAGDAVLLSPGCASFDWYRNYAERGVDFARAVTASLGEG